MRAMDRELLDTILKGIPSLEKSDAGYTTAGEHRVSIYLGGDGATTVLSDLVRLQLHHTHLEAEAKDRTIHYCLYGSILSVSIRRPREDAPRTGF